MAEDVKPFASFTQQYELLRDRGLIISNKQECIDFLQRTTYYRFSGYLLPFKTKDNKYKSGITFEQITNIYEFDRKLRTLLLQAIEQIEMYLRSQLSYYCCELYGPLCYQDIDIFTSIEGYIKFQNTLDSCLEKNQRSPILRHHRDKYGGNIPLWALMELFTLGDVSYFYKHLNRGIRKAIITESFYHHTYTFRQDDMLTWLPALVDLRNRCAHFNRLYYNIFSKTVNMPAKFPYNPDKSLFTQLLVVKFCCPPTQDFWMNNVEPEIEALITEYQNDIVMSHIGFPENWKELFTS